MSDSCSDVFACSFFLKLRETSPSISAKMHLINLGVGGGGGGGGLPPHPGFDPGPVAPGAMYIGKRLIV